MISTDIIGAYFGYSIFLPVLQPSLMPQEGHLPALDFFKKRVSVNTV